MKLYSLRPLLPLVAGLLLLLPSSARPADILRLFFDSWHYQDDGVDQGTAWRDINFDDSSWPFESAIFGFGYGDEVTTVQSPLNTAYFRSIVDVADPTVYSNLTLFLSRDDGTVIYLNGVEVYRNNMPTGAVTYATKAVRNIEGDEEFSFVQRTVPSSLFVAGPNVLAVEVHQAAGGDDDLRFALFVIGHHTDENQPPTAFDTFQTVEKDTSTGVTLVATDSENDPLEYTLLVAPQHGTLTGTAPNLTYTPETGYTGPDLFIFQVNDGVWSSEAQVSLNVLANRPPTADAQSLTVAEDNALSITVTATDPDGNPLTYTYTQPAHGVVTGSGSALLYQPAPNYFGPDSFTFTANDGNGGTSTATISINVTPVNDAPFAVSQSLATDEETALPILLTGNDVEADALTFAYNQPAHGVVAGSGALISYQPATDYNGPDSFTFSVSDGHGGTAIGTIAIAVAAVNDQPAADAQSLTVAEDGALPITLTGSDIDGDGLAFTFTQPSHGTVVGVGQNVTYSPSANYHGPDSFTFTVNDGNGGTASAAVSINVSAVNDAPTADGQTVSVNEDTAIGVLLSAADIDGDTLSYSYTQPAHGSVTGSGSTAIYQAAANYNGPDSFTFTVDDGNGGTATATVTVNVTAINDAPLALARAASTSNPTNLTTHLVLVSKDGQNVPVILNGANSFDVDSNMLSYAWYMGAEATPFSTQANPTLSLPVGNYAITLVVSDGTVTASDTVTVVIFSPCGSVQQLVADVQAANLKSNEKGGLLGHLNAACATFSNGNVSAAIHQLELFKDRVTSKVAPGNATVAAALNAKAQAIIGEMGQ